MKRNDLPTLGTSHPANKCRLLTNYCPCWPNEFVNAHLLLETRKNAVTSPASAILRGPDGSFAYVVDANNTVQMRPVQIALTQGSTVVVGSGLQGGDKVVTDGQEKLQAGSRVAPQAPARQNQQTTGNIGSTT